MSQTIAPTKQILMSDMLTGSNNVDVRRIKIQTDLEQGMREGLQAYTVQGYPEVNKKFGVEWEASRKVSATTTDPIYSILKTGSQTVDLKKRVFAYTGTGLTARIFINPTYTGGTPDPIYNMRPFYAGTGPESQLLVGFTLTDNGTECGAPIFAIGSASNQGKGSGEHEFATNRILEANTSYLLVIEPLEPQDIAARVEFYEGPLDYPEA